MRVYHNTRKSEYRQPFGAAEVSSILRLSIDVEDLAVEKVEIRYWQDECGESFVEMNRSGNRYEVEIKMPEEGTLFWYFFVISTSEGRQIYYGNNPSKTGGEGCVYEYEPPSFQVTVYKPAEVPDWFKSGTIYQIFPDRFARDKAWRERLESAGKAIEEDWYKPAVYDKDERGHVKTWSFYGGSLKGIEDKLDYLKSMGITGIYLNPIFKAASNHRYDTADYMEIDPALGTEEDFKRLCSEARKKNIRIILDGVFSHVGADSIYFDKYGNYGGKGAWGNPDSDYRSWFEFRDNDPIGYRAWWGVEDLPEVKEDEESFQQLICGQEGVLAKWLRAGASGIRLDVADELPDSFIKEVRTRIKAEDKENLLMGEVWEDASNKISYETRRKYLMGEELDSTMHYPLRDLLIDFALFKKSSVQVADEIMALAENYPKENFYGALNLIGSHDRERILTVMGADENYDIAAARVKMLAALQFALPGVPCIYYGDEAGMTGGADPENRNGFIWGKENKDLQAYYRKLGVIYKEHQVLKKGALEFIDTGNDEVLSFLREDEGQKMVVVVNRGESTEVNLEQLGVFSAEFALELMNSEELTREKVLFLEPRIVKIIYLSDKKPRGFHMGRRAGVICHISSIPGGKLGAPARSFVDYLESAGMQLWQILPLNPPGLGDSPYMSYGAFAGNTDFINLDELPARDGIEKFLEDNKFWLDDFADYYAENLESEDSDESVKQLVKETQYIFYCQWRDLKEYANSRGISIIGDLPIFVSADSADIRSDKRLFRIDEDGRLKVHAGVPPDYFNKEGQNWGNPLYDWDALEKDDYKWWTRRLEQAAERYDYVRLDHFRSFSEYFAIPENGKPSEGIWQQGPGMKFFEVMKEKLGSKLKILAEDLGQLDSSVNNLLKFSGLPGMNVWQFSSHDMMDMSPEEAGTRVFYTGTHDNQTLVSWCQDQGMKKSEALNIIKKLYESAAPWVILQIQDMLLLDDSARMNVPGTEEGNWRWHLNGDTMEEAIPNADRIAAGFRSLAYDSGRLEDKEMDEFLSKYNITVDDEILPTLVDKMSEFYRCEIQEGRIKGVPYHTNREDRTVGAVDLGGTNTRAALVSIKGNQVLVGKQCRIKTPGKNVEITADQMFDSVANLIENVDRDQTCVGIGLGFSFPADPVSGNRPDVKIQRWDKEIRVIDGKDRRVSNLVIDAMERRNLDIKPIAVANDTVTAFMAGTLISPEETPCIAGLVLGTGVNICYLDKESNEIYALEPGAYEELPSGMVDRMVDEKSTEPGSQLAEKMMSGAYRPDLISYAGDFAVAEGIVSKNGNTVKDKIRLKAIEDAITRRATQYMAIMVATSVRLSGFRDGEFNVLAEGSVFWKVEGFVNLVQNYVDKLLEDENVHVNFIRTSNAGLVGAAALV